MDIMADENYTSHQKYRVLALLAAAELLAMTLWFSVTAVGPELAMAWNLSGAETAWLTNAVQLGFVVGALLSTLFTVSDVIKPRYLFSSSAVVDAAATGIIARACFAVCQWVSSISRSLPDAAHWSNSR